MQEYEFEIREILQKKVCVKAKNANEAYNKVLNHYNSDKMILDSNDFKEKEIICRIE